MKFLVPNSCNRTEEKLSRRKVVRVVVVPSTLQPIFSAKFRSMDSEPPLLDDLIAFLWCKMQICPRDTLLNVIREFYEPSVIVQSRDKLFAHIPEPDGTRRVKHRKSEEILRSMYDLLQQIPSENPPVFAATNLNNLPAVDLKNVDGAMLVHNQGQLKAKVESLQLQMSRIQALLENRPASIAPVVTRSGPTAEPRPDAAGSNLPNRSFANALSITPNQRSRNVPNVNPQENTSDSSQEHQLATNEGNGQNPNNWVRVRGRRSRHRSNSQVVTGRKTGTSIRTSTYAAKSKIFVSRIDPNVTAAEMKNFVSEIVSDQCEVLKLQTKFSSYASFLIIVEERQRQKIFDPEAWEEGILLRPFYGKMPERSSTNGE